MPPSVAALVDALATFHRLDSRHIGFGGEESPAYQAYAKLALAITPAQARQLLVHESPIVRGYLANHVLNEQSVDAAAVAPLFGDSTSVETLSGCEGIRDTVGGYVARSLHYALARSRLGSPEHRELSALARRGAADPTLSPNVRVGLVMAGARGGDPSVKATALALLKESDVTLQASALDALFLLGADDVLTALAAPTVHPTPSVRRAAASVLGHIPGQEARQLLKKLAADPDKMVAASATVALLRHPSQARADILAALGGKDAGPVAIGLGRLGNPWAVELLIAASMGTLDRVRPTLDPAVHALMRGVATSTASDVPKALRKQAETWLTKLSPPGSP